ncbi:hypothetical protein ACJX0J_017958 [Zea mays]
MTMYTEFFLHLAAAAVKLGNGKIKKQVRAFEELCIANDYRPPINKVVLLYYCTLCSLVLLAIHMYEGKNVKMHWRWFLTVAASPFLRFFSVDTLSICSTDHMEFNTSYLKVSTNNNHFELNILLANMNEHFLLPLPHFQIAGTLHKGGTPLPCEERSGVMFHDSQQDKKAHLKPLNKSTWIISDFDDTVPKTQREQYIIQNFCTTQYIKHFTHKSLIFHIIDHRCIDVIYNQLCNYKDTQDA